MKVKPQLIIQGVLLFFFVLFFVTFRPLYATVAGSAFVVWSLLGKVWAARHEPGKDLIERAKAGDPEAQVELGLFKLKQNDRYGKSQEEAVQLFRTAAQQGDAEGCYQYGLAHALGTGSLVSDLQAAIQWWEKAAQLGHAAAMSQLADCYELGEGVKKDPAEALRLRKLAAEKGDATALSFIAWACYTGEGMPQDTEEACKLWLAAARKGSTDSQICIGDSYAEGDGVRQDIQSAVEWWGRAAESGNLRAVCRMGCAYALGCGVQQDLRKADKLLKQAGRVSLDLDYTSARIAGAVRAFIKERPAGLTGLADKGFTAGLADLLQTQAGITPLMVYVGEGDLPKVRQLLAEGADVHARADEGDDALVFAVEGGDEDCVRALLDAGAEVNPTAPGSVPPITYMDVSPGILRILLDAGADVNATNELGNTALHNAVTCENEESISLLVKAGADIHIKNHEDESPLESAQEYAPHLVDLLRPEEKDEDFFD